MTIFLDQRGINWTTANAMYRNAVANAEEISDREAQDRANAGSLVLAGCYNRNGNGHVAIVCPAEEEYDDDLGPLVGETGARCRITHVSNAFEKYGYEARFFLIPWRV
jgi:hypothetical protein